MTRRRPVSRQQLIQPLEDLEIPDLERVQDHVEHLLHLVSEVPERPVRWPWGLQPWAMSASRQVLRVVLAGEAEPQVGHPVLARDAQLIKHRPDPGLVRVPRAWSGIRWLQHPPHSAFHLAQQVPNQMSHRRPRRNFSRQYTGIPEERRLPEPICPSNRSAIRSCRGDSDRPEPGGTPLPIDVIRSRPCRVFSRNSRNGRLW